MNSKQSWTCLYFLLFFIVQERCDACNWMVSQYREKNGFCLSLLKEMGGEITTRHQPFPRIAYSEIDKAKTEDQVRFLAEATEHIVNLFSSVSDVDEMKWDSRALGSFLNILNYRQLKELKECTAKYAARPGHSSSERQLKRHFKKLRKSLKKANYSAISLERIRSVVFHHILRMDIIAANVRQKLMKN